MRILTRVDDSQFRRLAVSLSAREDLIRSSSWEEYAHLLTSRVIDVAAVNPLLDDHGEPSRDLSPKATGIILIPQRMPHVLYVYARGARGAARLINRGATDLLLWDVDDSPRELRNSLQRAASSSIAQSVWRELVPRVSARHSRLQSALEMLFLHPAKFRSAHYLADACGLGVRSLFRLLDMARLAHPHAVIQAARIAVAHQLVARQGATVKAAAIELGDASDRRLRSDIFLVTDTTAAHIGEVPEELLIDLLVRHATANDKIHLSHCSAARPAADYDDATVRSMTSHAMLCGNPVA